MLTLPPGFDVSVLVSDIVSCVRPLIPVLLLVSVGFLVLKILRKA